MTDVIDLHVHTAPDVFPRIADDLRTAQACASAGMAGMVVKCHYESTVNRAYLVNQQIADFTMYGGIALNYAVGGINPAAVQACLAVGGRVVWMPSGHSRYHAELTGALGGWGNSFMQLYNPPGAEGLSVLDEDGVLTESAHEVMALVAEKSALLGTSHLSPPEILAVVDEARTRGVRTLVNHVLYMPNCDLGFVQEIVERGAFVELCSVTVGGFWNHLLLEDAAAVVERAGAGNVVLASDGGGIQTPSPHESLRVFADNLLLAGIPEKDLRRMMVDNPRELLQGVSTAQRSSGTVNKERDA